MALQANLWRAIGQNPTEADLKRIIDENDTGTGHFQLDTWFENLAGDVLGAFWVSEEPLYLKKSSDEQLTISPAFRSAHFGN